MKKALFVSIFFNVLFLGIGCGYILHQIKGPVHHWQIKNQLRSSLSDKGKVYFDEWLEKVARKPNFRHKKREIMKILEANTFDEEAFLQVSSQLKQEHINRVERFSQATISLAAKLKVEERRLLAKHLPHLARPKRGKHKYR